MWIKDPCLWITLLVLIINAVRDLRKREIFLCGTMICASIGLVVQIVRIARGQLLWTQLITALLPGLFLMGMSLATGGKIGFGDGLVTAVVGIWAGCAVAMLTVIFGMCAVPVADRILYILKKRTPRSYPLIPFLAAAFVFAETFWGGS